MIGHGMLTRFPRLKVVIVEHFNEWTRPMFASDDNPLELISMLDDRVNPLR